MFAINRVGWLRPWSPVLVALLAALCFLPALGAGFVNWDDETSFLANPHFRGLGHAQIRWMFTTTLLAHWSPLTWLTWGLDYALGGLEPWGYHLASLLLHGATVALLCLVARRLLAAGFAAAPGSPSVIAGSVFAALVFGLHPLRVESVAWVSGRRDVLCGLFLLLAVLAYLRGVAGGGFIRTRWWLLSLITFAAALMSKASGMTLPAALLLIDVYPLRRRGWRGLLLEKLPYALLAAGAALGAVLARQEGGNITAYAQHGAEARVALTAYTGWFFVCKLVWPAGLSPMYELPVRVELSDPRFLLPLVGVIALSVGLVALRRRWPAGLAAWAFSLIALAPMSGAVHSGEQLVADRYSYLSGFGFAVLAGALVTWAVRRARAGSDRRWLAAGLGGAAVASIALGVATWQQTAHWRSSEALWAWAVGLDPSCSICESNLGRVIARPGRFEEAEAHVRRAIALRPDRAGPRENLGAIMLSEGRYGDAEAEFRRVVAIRPAHGPSWNGLGVALANQGPVRDAEAEAAFQNAGRLSPRMVDPPANLGMLYARQGRYDDAVPPLRHALALDESRASVRAGLARALRLEGVQLVRRSDPEQGRVLWREAAFLAPEDPDTLRDLGRALLEQGRAGDAVMVLERATAVAPRAGDARLWLVRAYRVAGRPGDADREAAALREMAPALAAELAR